jgi:hypothetical protein
MGYNKLLLSAAAVFLAISQMPEAAAQGKASGRLCNVYHIEQITPTRGDGACLSPSFRNEVGQCVHSSQIHNAFTYIINEDDSLDFGLSYWFASGAHCGISGQAESTGRNQWRYESNLDDPEKSCAVDISIQSDMVFFDADPVASCRWDCGASARLIGVTLPLSSAEGHRITQEDLNPEYMFNTPCGVAP